MQPRRNRRSKRVRSLETLEKRNLLFAPVDQTTMLGGLDTLAETLDKIETHAEYAEAIPGLQKSAGQLADFSQAVRGGLIEPLSNLLTATSEVDLADLTASLDGYASSFDGSAIEVLPGSVTAAMVDDVRGASVEVTATLQQSRTTSATLTDLNDLAWIGWTDASPTVAVKSESEMTVTVGVDLVSEEFFAKIGEVTTRISAATNDLSAGLRVGPVATSIVNGTVEIEATIVAGFGDLAITGDNLQGSALDDLFSVQANGSLDATLPVDFSLGSYSGSETITWQDSLAFDGVTETPQLSATGDLIAAVRIDQEDLRGFFSQIGTKLGELLGEDLPNFSDDFLPWVDGLKLPDLAGVSQKIRDFVNDDLSDDDNRPSFNTFEELRLQIETWTGRETLLSYLPNTSELTYEFEIPAPVDVARIDMSVDEDFNAIAGVDVTGTVGVTGEFVLTGLFGVDLTELTEDETPGDISDDDSWAGHFFVDDLELAASINVASDGASAAARLGFVGIVVDDVSLAASAEASIAFADDQTSDGRISFKRLSEAVVSDPLGLVESSTLSGNAEVSLRELSADGVPGLELDGGEITIGFADLSDPGSFTVDVNEAVQNINALSSVTFDQWVDLAGDVIAMVDALTTSGKWDQDLPGVGQSVNDLLDHAAKLQQAVDELSDANGATIQELGEQFELLLEDALGLVPNSLDVILNWKGDSLTMTVDYASSTSKSLPFSLDMADLIAASSSDSNAFDLLGDLVDVGGTTQIAADASFATTLSFGVDVADVLAGTATTPSFFVNDTSDLEVQVSFSATDMDASIALGPLGLFIQDGTLTIDADGDAGTSEPAKLSAGLAKVSEGRYSVDEIRMLDATDAEIVFQAGASIVLPLYFPTVDDPVGGGATD
ncbi:MAG: hypothetical protein AAF989_11185, partial [Planctomycetota bacterium]